MSVDKQALVSKGEETRKETNIPDSFIQCPAICCAFRCDHFDCGNCFGFKGNSQCLCFEEEGFCCKISKDGPCCVCCATNLELVACPGICKCYRQCFCIEWICGCPFDNGYLNTQVGFHEIPSRGGADYTKDSRPCLGICCSLTSLYIGFPACLSAYQKTDCIFTQLESLCCKPTCCENTSTQKSSLCLVQKAHCFLVMPKTCLKSTFQLFCLDHRCAIPCDNEVPCVFMPLPFLTLCSHWAFNFACCATLADMANKINDRKA